MNISGFVSVFTNRAKQYDVSEISRAIRAHGTEFQKLTDAQLGSTAEALRERALLSNSPTGMTRHSSRQFNELLYQAIALGSEATRRISGLIPYDVQLLAAVATALANLIEMQTGEGKTLVAGLSAIGLALCGRNVHVATTNDYLAERDFSTLRDTFQLLNIRAGILPKKNDKAKSQAAYACQIVYGPGYQFGFDFLFDQITRRRHGLSKLGTELLHSLNGFDLPEELLQSGKFDAIVVDEVDSVLIDEALTPLILSFGESHKESPAAYQFADKIALSLVTDEHFRTNRKLNSLELTAKGIEAVQEARDQLGTTRLERRWQQYVENALRARHLIFRDEHYVVEDDKVKIVDQFTGRIFDDRTWQSGLHQAIEAKEKITISSAKQSHARITRQRYTKQYKLLSGMSGTIVSAAAEFWQTFQAKVVSIPTHRPCRRVELPARYFLNCETKFSAIADEVFRRHQQGQPILIGTRTIRESRRLEEVIRKKGLEPVVLNGIQDRDEAEIIAQAGQSFQITIATNMAGRGTDIKLNEDSRSRGGLHVIGTEPNPIQRIDRQLIGRAARQGDPGSSQFFVSAEDELLVRRNPRLAMQIQRASDANGECPHDFADELERTQRQEEASQALIRQQLVQSDNWLDTVRETIFGE